MVPLWWGAGTTEDLRAWKSDLVGIRFGSYTACRSLGRERLESLTIHHRRHTFICHALAYGRTQAEVRDAVGHANVSITSAYLHMAVEDEGVGRLFSTTDAQRGPHPESKCRKPAVARASCGWENLPAVTFLNRMNGQR